MVRGLLGFCRWLGARQRGVAKRNSFRCLGTAHVRQRHSDSCSVPLIHARLSNTEPLAIATSPPRNAGNRRCDCVSVPYNAPDGVREHDYSGRSLEENRPPLSTLLRLLSCYVGCCHRRVCFKVAWRAGHIARPTTVSWRRHNPFWCRRNKRQPSRPFAHGTFDVQLDWSLLQPPLDRHCWPRDHSPP